MQVRVLSALGRSAHVCRQEDEKSETGISRKQGPIADRLVVSTHCTACITCDLHPCTVQILSLFATKRHRVREHLQGVGRIASNNGPKKVRPCCQKLESAIRSLCTRGEWICNLAYGQPCTGWAMCGIGAGYSHNRQESAGVVLGAEGHRIWDGVGAGGWQFVPNGKALRDGLPPCQACGAAGLKPFAFHPFYRCRACDRMGCVWLGL